MPAGHEDRHAASPIKSGLRADEPRMNVSTGVEEPSVSVWGFWPWPHYEVEHHYTVEDEHVTIHDRHYFPSYGRSRAYILNDNGKHRGWYKHGH